MLHIILPFNIILSILILNPYEKYTFKKFYKSAKEKLSSNKTCKKIIITGSCGKTTVKNIIYNLIKDNYYVLKTPASFNTLNGIIKFINEEFNNSVDILIIEAGACKKGDIKEICELIEPDIGAITEITEQHLETFKTIDNLINTKLELIDYIKNNNYFIYNKDNLYLSNRLKDKSYRTVCIKDAKIIKMLPRLEFSFNNIIYKTNLIGKHQVINIFISFEVVKCLEEFGFKFNQNQLLYNLNNMNYINNRLEYKKVNNIEIYNDSYNSNRIGFLNAIEIMSYSKNKKIIITPGIVELGTYKKIINEEIAYKISKVFDEIYIIRSEVSKYYIEIFNKLSINYLLFDSFIAAYKYVISNNSQMISLLIENDISDIYKER